MTRGRAEARRDERGAVAIVAALISLVLLMVCSLVVDLGMTWQRRGELQRQADKAAVYAAAGLPATDETTRLRVAKRAAFYLACNAVPGQRALNTIPECPAGPMSPDLDTFAQEMLDDGLVSFPSATQVQVITPRAEVIFAFAGVIGVDGTEQRKSATAKVSSPGEILPMGLSLQCMTGIVNNAGLGNAVDGILPLSYVTAGASSGGGGPVTENEPPFVPWEAEYSGANASGAVQVSDPSTLGTTLTLGISSPGFLPTLGGLLGATDVVFKRGDVTVGPVPATSVDALTSTLTVALPSAVSDTPGVWHVKARTYTGSVLGLGVVGTNPRWSEGDVTFAVYPSESSLLGRLSDGLDSVLDLRDFLACARLLDSPRVQDGGTPALTRNWQEGLDHALTANQALVQGLGTQNLSMLNGTAAAMASALGAVDSVIANPTYGLLGCAGSTYNRLDTTGTYAATVSTGGAPANCARIRSDAAAEQEFTDGLLKTSPSNGIEPGFGRLSCYRDGACEGHTTTLPGFTGTFNDDGFRDFVNGGASMLDSNLAYAIDTYLLPGLPVVTPNGKLEEDLYRSPRFGWVPVLSYVDLNSPGTADYPILTFRPVFLDNGSAPDLEIAGLTPGRVVDGLAPYLRTEVEQAVLDVQASLGALGASLSSVLATLGLPAVYQDLELGDVDAALARLGDGLGADIGRERSGLLLQDGKVKAARFLTVAPDALPVVDQDFRGPVTDYLGVGPKIVRLVR